MSLLANVLYVRSVLHLQVRLAADNRICVIQGDMNGCNGCIFVKAKCDLDVLPPIHVALELHITRANSQAKTWLKADHVIMDLEKTETIDLWQEGTD